MKKIIAIILLAVLLLGVVVCTQTDYVLNPSKYTDEEEILNIALEHCKTNYDYTEIDYISDSELWEVGFWENGAQIAAQTITLDKDGNVIYIRWAE